MAEEEVIDISTVNWEGSFEGWSHKWVSKNFWRVEALMDYADAIQECAMLFCFVRDHYRGRVTNAKWLMSLFKTTVRNHWHTTSSKASMKRSAEVQVESLADYSCDEIECEAVEILPFTLRRIRLNLKPSQPELYSSSNSNITLEGGQMTIHQELCNALKVPETTDPASLDFIRNIASVDEAVWNALSEKAQSWYNGAAKAVNEGKPVPACPGYKKPAAEKPAATRTPVATAPVTEAAAPAGEPAAPVAEAAAPATKPAKAAKEAKPAAEPAAPKGKRGSKRLFELIVRANGDATTESLKAQLAAESITLSDFTISYYADMYKKFKAVEAAVAAAA